jgi:DNA-binding GntR family transcriptional regulator
MGVAHKSTAAPPQSRARASKPVQGSTPARSKGNGAAEASSLRGDLVYAALRNEIRNGQLQPGDRLLEIEIAKRLGVSRTPVREALKRLESDGLVSFGQPRGLTVTKLTHGQILELYAVREVLEGAAARFAAERAAPFEIDSLKQILAQHDDASTPAEAADANRRLHAAIVAATHNVYLQRMINVLTDALVLLGTTTYTMPGRIASGWKENAKIVACIERRDASAAEEAGRRHIRAAAAMRIAMNAKR